MAEALFAFVKADQGVLVEVQAETFGRGLGGPALCFSEAVDIDPIVQTGELLFVELSEIGVGAHFHKKG